MHIPEYGWLMARGSAKSRTTMIQWTMDVFKMEYRAWAGSIKCRHKARYKRAWKRTAKAVVREICKAYSGG